MTTLINDGSVSVSNVFYSCFLRKNFKNYKQVETLKAQDFISGKTICFFWLLILNIILTCHSIHNFDVWKHPIKSNSHWMFVGYIFGNILPLKIMLLIYIVYKDISIIGEELQNSYLCSVPRASTHGGIFIEPQLQWHDTQLNFIRTSFAEQWLTWPFLS